LICCEAEPAKRQKCSLYFSITHRFVAKLEEFGDAQMGVNAFKGGFKCCTVAIS
jgi:hypothetical protein